MDCRVVSIPWSGTTFMCELLDCKFTHMLDDPKPADIYVCPLRDPQKTWASWYPHVKGTARENPDHPRSFEAHWKALRDDLFFIPIDTDAREGRLQELSEMLGRELQTEWTPVRTSAIPKPEIPAKNLGWVYELVGEFYYADR